MFKKLLSDNRNMQLSHRPISPSRSITPSRLPSGNLFVIKPEQIIRSPLKQQYSATLKQPNQYLANHLQRKCTSPLKSPLRSPSPLVRKNTYQQPNNRSPMRNLTRFAEIDQYQSNRMPESCYIPSTFVDSSQGRENTKSNIPLFSAIVRDENIKSENVGNFQIKRQPKQNISFMSLIKKQYSLGMKVNHENQQSYTHDRENNAKGSITTTTDFSSGNKMSFKESLKGKPKASEVIESLQIQQNVVLKRQSIMLDSVGTISKNDRVNESIAEESFMDLNMEPCFDM